MLQKDDLSRLRDFCLRTYAEEKNNICFIILYGGAAKNFVKEKTVFDDFDVNIFFKYESKIKSTHGMPEKIMPEKIDELYEDKRVEIMRNKLKECQSWNDLINFIRLQKSKRWVRIRKEPIIGLFPGEMRQIN